MIMQHAQPIRAGFFQLVSGEDRAGDMPNFPLGRAHGVCRTTQGEGGPDQLLITKWNEGKTKRAVWTPWLRYMHSSRAVALTNSCRTGHWWT